MRENKPMEDNRQIIQEYSKLLDNVKRFVQPKREKTVFSIGGRGHYENPVSDVLSFFIDPREEHQFRNLFLSCFFKLLNSELEVETIEWIEREAITKAGNRIDLVVVSESWVLIIENKIYHSLLNPLNDYEAYAQEMYPDKRHLLVVLSIGEQPNIPLNWQSILYRDLLIEIKKEAGPYLFDSRNAKWAFFLKDFLLNIEELIGEYRVDKELMDFAQLNYSKILELIEVKENYINSLKKTFSSLLSESTGNKVIEKIHTWSKRIPIRFYCPNAWGEQSNLVLVLHPEGDFKIYYYIYGIEENDQDTENTKLLMSGFKHWKENKETILCYKSEKKFDLEEAKEAFIIAAQHLDDYFSSSPSKKDTF
jgi:hypothetical protein